MEGGLGSGQRLDPTIGASISIFYASEAAMEVVNDALQILGGYGYTKMFPVEKLLRDIRLFSIYEGTSEVQRLIISGHVLNSYKPVMPALEDLPLIRGLDPRMNRRGGKPPHGAAACAVISITARNRRRSVHPASSRKRRSSTSGPLPERRLKARWQGV